jgi:CRP/FNR family transcriptional regulator, anaerobic regulatory protein
VCRSIAHLRDLHLVTINSRNVEIHDLCGLTQLVAGCHRPPTF